MLSHSVMSDFLKPHGFKACSLPGFSVQGTFQARILEWVAISSSRGSSRSRGQTHFSCVTCIAGRFFTTEPLGSHQKKVYAAVKCTLSSYELGSILAKREPCDFYWYPVRALAPSPN